MRLFRGFRPEMLGFVAFFSTFMLYSPNLVVFGEGMSLADMDAFAPPMLLASFVMASLLLVFSERITAAHRLHRAGLTAAGILYLSGALLFYWLTLNSDSAACATLAGCLIAAGATPLCIAWGAILSRFELRPALLFITVSCAISALLVQVLQAHTSYIVLVCLVIAGATVPVVKAWRGTLMDQQAPSGSAGIEPTAPHSTGTDGDGGRWRSLGRSLRGMGSVVLPAIIGLMVFAFTMGLRKLMFFDTVHGENIGAWMAVLVVFPLCFFRPGKPLFSFIYQVFLPSLAVVVILLDSFPPASLPFTVGAAAIYVFYSVVGALTIASLCALAHAREFSPTLIFSVTIAVFTLCSFLGIQAGTSTWIAANPDSFLLVVSTAYLAYLVFMPGWRAWRQGSSPSHAGALTDDVHPESFQERCDTLARRFGLSPRETEILGFLGHGYSPAYVARTLMISDSTARVHVRNIYRKMEVSSREELIERFEQQAAH